MLIPLIVSPSANGLRPLLYRWLPAEQESMQTFPDTRDEVIREGPRSVLEPSAENGKAGHSPP